MKRNRYHFLITCLLPLLAYSSGLFSQDLVLTSYGGQAEISATGSVTLKPGFHVPSGANVRIHIGAPSGEGLNSMPSADRNYILTTTYLRPFTAPPAGLATDDAMQEVTYYDGLGRPSQEVIVKGSPTFKDVVRPIEYNAFGREAKKYLPYTTAGTPGAFKTTAAAAQAAFYATPPARVAGSPHPYAQTVFEPSPLNRVSEQGFAGAAWQPQSGSISGSGHTVKTEHTTNNTTAFSTLSSTRKVALYGVNLASDGTPTLTLSDAYAAGQLYVMVMKDENWTAADGRAGTAEEYTDKQGRVVLKRVFNRTPSGALEMLSTYYVHDAFGNLSFVLPPGADPDRATVPTAAALNAFCYQYRYDGRNRPVEKKLPGKGWEYTVYNKLDRVVATQDANQRTPSTDGWTFTKYDALGRVVMTGRYQSNSNRATLQTSVNGQSTLWEGRDPANNGSGATGYTNGAFPQSGIAEYYTINYYDNYDLPADCPSAWRTPGSGHSSMTHGLRTATKTKVLGTNTYLWSVSYYDDKGRVVQTNGQHHLGGTDVVANTYNFTGQLTSTARVHKKGTTTTTVRERYDYDHRGRLVNTWHKINGQQEVLIASNTYNEVGGLITKGLHSEDNGGGFLQKVDYHYNIRGWLTSINGTDLPAAENDLFGLELNYTDNDRSLQVYPGLYNGNIAEMIWNTNRTSKPRGYAFNYDDLNRISNAAYRAYNGNWIGDGENGRYSLAGIAYDKMGNILSLKRQGATGASSFGTMDDLAYAYSGNRLAIVNEKSTGNRGHGFKEPVPTGGTEYTYDANGNLKTDANKGTTAIVYNHRNLPERIAIGGHTIEYRYLPDGTKVQKTAGINVTHYINGVHYNGSSIDFIRTAEGRALRSPATGLYSYEYNLTDHLGNVRVSFDKNPSTGKARIIQEDSYYPFGLTFNSYVSGTKNKYTFQGQELQDEYGLGWLQFKWRMHDPAIGRFVTVDPLAEKYHWQSPYVFSSNEVTHAPELEGLEVGYELRSGRRDRALLNGEISKGQYLAELKAEGMGALAGLSFFIPGPEDLALAGALGTPLGRMILRGVGKLLGKGDEVVDATKVLNKNKEIGKKAEDLVTNDLKKEFKGDQVLKQVTGKFDDGTTTKFDNVVVDPKTGKVKLVNETKSGGSRLSKQQKRYYEQGETATLKGKNAGGAEGKTVNTNNTNTRVTRKKREDID